MLNAIAPGAMTPTATPTAPGVPTPTPENYRAANPGTQLEPWQIKFSLYFPNSTWRGKEFLTFHRPIVPQKLVKLLLSRAGEIFSDAEVVRLRNLRAKQDLIHAKLDEANFWASTKLWQAQQDAASEKILSGDLSEVTLKSKVQIREEIGRAREALHAALLPLGQQVFDILAPACARLRAVARDMAEAQDAKERAVHDSNCGDEMPFVPSEYLRTLAFLALHSCDAPIRNFHLTKRLHCPDPDKLLEIWFPPVTAAPVRLASQSTAENPTVTKQHETAAAINAEAHRAELVEKNALTEKIKADIQTTAEETELARMKAEIDEATRKEVLKKKLQDAADTTKPVETKP
jgi:hypothetical protein